MRYVVGRALRRDILVDILAQNCREEHGIHTCDLRSSLSHLCTSYTPPTYAFEPDFAETDPHWDADEREPPPHRVGRARKVLDVAFTEDAICTFRVLESM